MKQYTMCKICSPFSNQTYLVLLKFKIVIPQGQGCNTFEHSQILRGWSKFKHSQILTAANSRRYSISLHQINHTVCTTCFASRLCNFRMLCTEHSHSYITYPVLSIYLVIFKGPGLLCCLEIREEILHEQDVYIWKRGRHVS